MSSELQLTGMNELLDKIEELGVKGNSIANDALKKAGQPILEDAKSTDVFRDRTGRGRASLKISQVKQKAGTKYVLVGVDRSDNSEGFYLKFIEFGTSKMPARPFLAPAYEKNKNQALQIIKEELKRGLNLK